MTNITIDRKFLEEVVELFDSAITARHPHEILRDIRAALAAPATAPAQPAWHDAPTVPDADDILRVVCETDPADFNDKRNICISPEDLGDILRDALPSPTPTASKLHVWQAAKATCPAWHDAPTVPGLWVSDFSWMAQKLGRETVEFYAKNRSIPSRRWYGPIPEDKP